MAKRKVKKRKSTGGSATFMNKVHRDAGLKRIKKQIKDNKAKAKKLSREYTRKLKQVTTKLGKKKRKR